MAKQPNKMPNRNHNWVEAHQMGDKNKWETTTTTTIIDD